MEQVLVVNTADLAALIGNKIGFIEFDKDILDLLRTKSFFIDRDTAESDETFKQVIPYSAVIKGNRILAVKRKDPGEKRLKGLVSIGIGGHINPEDSGTDILFNAALRELREETSFSGGVFSNIMGFLSLDDPVSRVHFGVVYKINVDGDVKVIDSGLEGNFVPLSDLTNLADKMEGWSRALAEKIKA